MSQIHASLFFSVHHPKKGLACFIFRACVPGSKVYRSQKVAVENQLSLESGRCKRGPKKRNSLHVYGTEGARVDVRQRMIHIERASISLRLLTSLICARPLQYDSCVCSGHHDVTLSSLIGTRVKKYLEMQQYVSTQKNSSCSIVSCVKQKLIYK